jgi:hypothetical protein
MKRPNLEAMDEGAARFDSELSNVISWAMNRERRVAELEGERDTVVELASRLEVDIESLNQTDTELTAKVAELQAQLDRANALNAKVAAIWRASYGNATALHIAMIGVFPGEGES